MARLCGILALGLVTSLTASVHGVQINLHRVESGGVFDHCVDCGTATGPPSNSSLTGGGTLEDIVAAAADWWKMHLPGTNEGILTINYGWQNLPAQYPTDPKINIGTNGITQVTGGQHATRPTEATIQFNQNIGSDVWFMDPSPGTYDEWDALGDPTPGVNLNGISYANMGGGVMTIGRRFTSGRGGANGNTHRDLFSTAIHELGHALGLASNFDGFINQNVNNSISIVAPLPYAGAQLATDPGGTAHLATDAFPAALMCDSCATNGVRRIPSDADILAVAQVGSYQVNLYPDFHWTGTGFAGLGDGSITDLGPFTNHWDRNLVPGPASNVNFDAVAPSNPYTVTVDGNVYFNTLTVDNNNQVQFAFTGGRKMGVLDRFIIRSGSSLTTPGRIDIGGGTGEITSGPTDEIVVGGFGNGGFNGRVIILSGGSFVAGSVSGGNSATIINNGTLITGGDNSSSTFSGVISGLGDLTKTGIGIMSLSGSNSYAGATNINGGTLQIGASQAIPNISAVTIVAGARLDLNNFNNTIASLGGSGNVFLGGGNLSTGGNGTFSGRISGSGGVTKTGGGTLTFTGANSYSGATQINGGTVQFATINSMPTGAVTVDTTLAVNAGGSGEWTGSTAGAGSLGRLIAGDNSAGTAGKITWNSGSALGIDTTNTPGGALTYSGTIGNFRSGSGTTRNDVGLTKLGSGTLTLSGANSYTGGTTIAAGTLQFAKTNSMHSTSTDGDINSATLAVNAGGTGEWTNGTSGGGTIGGLIAGTGGQGTANQWTWNSDSALGIDTTNTPGGALTYSGTIGNFRSGSGTTRNDVGLTKLGIGILILTDVSTYTGTTTISGGTLSGNVIANRGENSAFGQGNFWISNGATLQYTGPDASTDHTMLLRTGGGTIDIAASLLWQGEGISGPGGLTKMGSGILTLESNNAYSGPTVIQQGELRGNTMANIGSSSAFGAGSSISISNGATLRYTGPSASTNRTISLGGGGGTIRFTTGGSAVLTLNGVISGVGGFTKHGSGEIRLGADNTYSGSTVIIGGTLSLGASERIPDGSAVTIASGTELDLKNFNETIGSLEGSGDMVLGNGNLLTGGNNSSTTFSGRIGVIIGSGGIEKYGAGTMILSGDNTYTGGTGAFAGTLQFAKTNSMPASGIISVSGFGNSATLAVNAGGTSEWMSGISGGGTIGGLIAGTGGEGMTNQIKWYTNSTLGIDTSNAVGGTLTYTGVIGSFGNESGGARNDVGFAKLGSGTLVLTSASTYTGDTKLQGGTLSIAGADLADAADVYLSNGTTFNLNFTTGSPDVIDSLFINNVMQATGTWGAIGSGAAHETVLITGPGMLFVSTGASGVPGDYNRDGLVDSADYVTWRKGLGTIFTQADYNVWRANFGQTAGNGAQLNSGESTARVPEQATLMLLVPALAWCVIFWRNRMCRSTIACQ